MRFTFEVLNLVFLAGARDGEMGGDRESSPAIIGIDRGGDHWVYWCCELRVGGCFMQVVWAGMHCIRQQGIQCSCHDVLLLRC